MLSKAELSYGEKSSIHESVSESSVGLSISEIHGVDQLLKNPSSVSHMDCVSLGALLTICDTPFYIHLNPPRTYFLGMAEKDDAGINKNIKKTKLGDSLC